MTSRMPSPRSKDGRIVQFLVYCVFASMCTQYWVLLHISDLISPAGAKRLATAKAKGKAKAKPKAKSAASPAPTEPDDDDELEDHMWDPWNEDEDGWNEDEDGWNEDEWDEEWPDWPGAAEEEQLNKVV